MGRFSTLVHFGDAFVQRSLAAGTVGHFMLGMAVGALVGFIALDPGFIAGTGGAWVRPPGDWNAYLVAWHYFVGDSWRLPVFEVPGMSYPEGSNVVFSDVLPLTALATKALHSSLGVTVVPFGWWYLLTYVLQGALAARLVRACGGRSMWASIGAATLAVCNIAFTWRVGHTALSSHFVIIWALALYFESARRGRLKAVETSLLLAFTMMVNSYLFAIVAALAGATVVELWRHKQLTWADARTLGTGFFIVFAVALLQGYGVIFTQPRTMMGEGLGVYSWNIVTLLVPPVGVGEFPFDVVRDATGGQYEGEAYIGLGATLMLVIAVTIGHRTLLVSARRHAVLVGTLVLLAAVAASNKVYAGNVLLFAYDVPSLVNGVASAFRGTGRFILPLAYALTVVPIALVFRQLRPALAVPVIVAAMALQAKQTVPTVQNVRLLTSQPAEDLIDTPRLSGWMMLHQRLWKYPSWFCGGAAESGERELQVQLLAARMNRPTNSVYASRSFKDCVREAEWAVRPQLEDGVLYLVGPEAELTWPALSALANSEQCVELTWGLACSKAWSRRSQR